MTTVIPDPDAVTPLSQQQFSRRQVLRWGAVGTGAAAVTLVVGVTGPVAPAGAETTMPAAAAAGPALPDSRRLPVVFGTPTDIARTRGDVVWARDADGTVVRFDRDRGIWQPVDGADWAALHAAGTAVRAQWGHPSGRTRQVLVIGPTAAPSTPGTTPDPTPAPSSAPGAGGTAPTTTAPTITAPSPTQPAAPPTTGGASLTTAGTASAAGRGAGRPLSYTGFDAGRYLGVALAAVAGGGALVIAARNRGMRRAEAGSPTGGDPGPDGEPPSAA